MGRTNRQREYELLQQQVQQQYLRSRIEQEKEDGGLYEEQQELRRNMLEPDEEYMEQKRIYRTRHVVRQTKSSKSGSFGENLGLLLVMVILIYALYEACLYLLSQA